MSVHLTPALSWKERGPDRAAAPVLLLGATSMVGFALVRVFGDGVTPIGNPFSRTLAAKDWTRARLEGSLSPVLRHQLRDADVVLYCHAVCDVAKCQANPDWAYELNVLGLDNVLAQLRPTTRVVYLSSDHVFGGDGVYSESATPTPISAYGQTRVEAEQRVLHRPGSLVIRAGLPIGPSINGRTGFRDWLHYRAAQGLPVTIIHDEHRSAVCVDALARRVMALALSQVTGVRHIPATRAVSRPELARYLMRRAEFPPGFTIESRHQQPVPHLGHVEIRSDYGDALGQPLPSVIEGAAWSPTQPQA